MNQLEHIENLKNNQDKKMEQRHPLEKHLVSSDPIVLDPSKAGEEKQMADAIQNMSKCLSNLENKLDELLILSNKIYDLSNK
ncbi:MAG: hypothetical protein J5629_07305 [Muribaculaceae bacterium]|nr:hypothetical protein [Muribaculaceae bacterium]